MRRQMEYGNGYRTRDSGTPTFAARLGLRKDWPVGGKSGSIDLSVRAVSRVRERDDQGQLLGSASG
jgi:hemoglobin/transferrin/lactoferrin receptor protein